MSIESSAIHAFRPSASSRPSSWNIPSSLRQALKPSPDDTLPFSKSASRSSTGARSVGANDRPGVVPRSRSVERGRGGLKHDVGSLNDVSDPKFDLKSHYNSPLYHTHVTNHPSVAKLFS